MTLCPSVRRLLAALDAGDASPWSGLEPTVEATVRRVAGARLARAASSRSTDPLHCAYLRLLRQAHGDGASRRRYAATVARSVLDLLVDHARRGGAGAAAAGDVLALDRALRALQHRQPDQHEVWMLHELAGLPLAEVADMIGMPEPGAAGVWHAAGAWLQNQLGVDRRAG